MCLITFYKNNKKRNKFSSSVVKFDKDLTLKKNYFMGDYALRLPFF